MIPTVPWRISKCPVGAGLSSLVIRQGPTRQHIDLVAGVFVGRREIDGKAYDVVRADVDTLSTMNYFDAVTGLLARTEVVGETPTVMTFHDYERFDGLLFATRMVTRVGDKGEMVTRVVSIDHKPIDLRVFAPPPNAAKQP